MNTKNGRRKARAGTALALCLPWIVTLFFCAETARAGDLPPGHMLNLMAAKLGKKLPPARMVFRSPSSGGHTDDICRMQHVDVTVVRGTRAVNTFHVLTNRWQHGSSVAPKEILALSRRISVDADGSPRAYHPEDPYGVGACHRTQQTDGTFTLDRVCALDRFANGSIHVFRGSEKLGKPALEGEWKRFWPLVRDRRLKSFKLEDVAGPHVPEGYYLFHWKDRNLTVFFRSHIIPSTRDGYPCLHGSESRFAGYFVAATTLLQDGAVREDGCAPSRYIDSEQIPYFVLPAGSLGRAGMGDIVVGRAKIGSQDRIVYGIAADAGPAARFGEGSIAFNQALLGNSGDFVRNIHGLNALDIAGVTVTILILGETKDLLRGNYTRRNVEDVGRKLFAEWNGDDASPMRRIDACIRQQILHQRRGNK